MTKLIAFLTLFCALLAGGLFFGSSLFTSEVMADTADAGPVVCHKVQVPLDEGYGVTSMVSRTECHALH